MKVLLINPPTLSMYSLFGLSIPPMGLLYVAAALEKAGHQVTISDLTVEYARLEDNELAEADIIGISCDTTRADRVLALSERAKKAGKKVIIGGPHPQFMPDEMLSAGTVDFIVKGEGEAIFPALLDVIESGEEPDSVAGLIFIKNGQMLETADAARLDVEQLPFPARHLLDLSNYRGVVDGRPAAPLVSSRGCPGACHFCSSSSFFGRRWRARSAESVLTEIDELYNNYSYRAIAFMDDNFTLDPKRTTDICNGIIQRGYDLKWWNFSRIDTIVKNPEMVRKMADAGSYMVYLGIESDNPETLNSLGKQNSKTEVKEAIRILKENRIESYGSYIIGNLNEKPADVEQTISLAIQLDTNIAQFSILTPYPGTVLYQQIKDRIFTSKWKFYDGLHLVFRHPLISRHHLQYLLIMAFIRFYRRSAKSASGFKENVGRADLSFGKLIRCVLEMLV